MSAAPQSLHAGGRPPRARDGAVAVATQMFRADLLKLRKKPSTVIWSVVLAIAPIVIFFLVRAIQHSSDPWHALPNHRGYAGFEPAGGYNGFRNALQLLAVFFGPLAAILIGTEAGAGDAATGVFRDLVVTGRSRFALFASRVPAAVALGLLIALLGYGLTVLGTFAFAGGLPNPSGATVVNGLGFTILAIGVPCALAVGFASLSASRPAALVVLIGWDLIASPILANVESLGSSRDALFSQAIAHFSPVALSGRHGATVSMSGGLAIVVLVAWLVALLGLGAWRTRTMDA